MGQSLGRSQLLQETQIFATWTINDVKELAKRFRTQVFGYALVEAQFESIISFKENMTKNFSLETLFDILDNDNDGRIDGLELLAGLTLCCNAQFEEKAKFCFELFDFNLNATLSKKEMVVMMMASICGMNLLTGGNEDQEPDLDTFEKLASNAFLKADKDKSGNISFEEFVTWARSNREMMAAIEGLTQLSIAAKLDIDSDDSAPATSEDDLSDFEILLPPSYNDDIHNNNGNSNNNNYNPIKDISISDDSDQFSAVVKWKSIHNEPTNYKPSRLWRDGPESNMNLSWVHGIRGKEGRNYLRYVQQETQLNNNNNNNNNNSNNSNTIVYPCARLGVVYNITDGTQKTYQGHDAQITCLCMHPAGRIVATGDINSQIHIWDPISLEFLGMISGIVKQGIQHIQFSPDGVSVVTVGLDLDHTIAIYNTTTGDVISSSKGFPSPNNVFDIAYSNSGSELCIVGRKGSIMFYKNIKSKQRALKGEYGIIGKIGKRQTFFCVAYCGEDPIVGCANGEIYKFINGKCSQIIQAHNIGEPILSMYYNINESTLVTGGRDGIIRTWTSNLKEVGNELDLAEDLDGDGLADNKCLDNRVLSVHNIGNKILVGTKGSDIFEAIMPSTPSDNIILTQLAWGHATGELWGLATHPNREEFATSGDDKTVRIWSIRTNEMLNIRVLPNSSRTLSYNMIGNLLCVGMQDGTIAILDSSNLRVKYTWKHSIHPITDIKFSYDSYYLAISSCDGNIYIYKSNDRLQYYRQAVCRGHIGKVSHIDFSLNGKYIQSCGSNDYSLYYWDMNGNKINSNSIMRDIDWATRTCTYGWSIQGIYNSQFSSLNDINTCHAVSEVGVLVTGDNHGLVKLFRYPSLDPGAIRQAHYGHSGNVTCVRFTYNRRYVISISGTDRTIIVWNHELEILESSDEDECEDISHNHNIHNRNDNYHDSDNDFYNGHDDDDDDGDNDNNNNFDDNYHINNIESKNNISYKKLIKTNNNSNKSSSTSSLLIDYKLEIADVGDRTILEEAVHRQQSTQELIDLYQELYSTEVTVPLPWKSCVVEPENWRDILLAKNPYQSFDGATDVDLELNWVHGYRSYDCRNNLRYNAAGEIIYHTATLGVVYSKSTGKQKFLLGAHSDDILGLTSHPAGQIFATGEAGKNPSIIIWNSETARTIKRLTNTHTRGISLLAFNFNGHFLASIGLDQECTLAVHEWKKGALIMKTSTNKGKVLCLCFLAPGERKDNQTNEIIATGGIGHLKFWSWNGQNVTSQKAIWNIAKRYRNPLKSIYPDILSISSASPMVCIAGTTDGKLLIFKNYICIGVYDNNINNNTNNNNSNNNNNNNSNNTNHSNIGSPVQCIWSKKSQFTDSYLYFTGDKAGNIAIWEYNEDVPNNILRCIAFLSINNTINIKLTDVCNYQIKNPSIRSICERDGMILFGTQGTEIIEIPYTCDKNSDNTENSLNITLFPELSILVLCGHGNGEVWGLATHNDFPHYFTSGDDGSIRCWSLNKNKLIYCHNLSKDTSRSLSLRKISDNTFHLACGCHSGKIKIYEVKLYSKYIEMKKVLERNDTHRIIQVLSYSNDGCYLAAGSHDTNIYLYSIDSKSELTFQILSGHSGSITHLDFGQLNYFEKDIILQSTCHHMELRFWRISKSKNNNENNNNISTQLVGQQLSAVYVKDAIWSTWTCPLGWPVQGIWPTSPDGAEVIAVTRSFSWEDVPVIATVDNFGRVRLFNYPASHSGAPDKCYRGHSKNIRNISFSSSDEYCISTGGEDKSIFIWSTDIQEELAERQALSIQQQAAKQKTQTLRSNKKIINPIYEDSSWNSIPYIEDDGELYNNNSNNNNNGDDDFNDEFSLNKKKKKQIKSLQLWKSVVREPSTWNKNNTNNNNNNNINNDDDDQFPSASLELSYVYGYRGWDCRNNIGFADSTDEIVYHVAGVGIVLTISDNTQIHNTEHIDDILCLAVHPKGHTVATGEIGKFPKLVLWDANTGVTLRVIMFHQRGISHLKFTTDGKYIISVGMDLDGTVAIHECHTGIVTGSGKIGRGVNINVLAVGSNTSFITGGKMHMKFWDVANNTGGRVEFSSKGGLFSKEANSKCVISAAYLGTDAVTGMSDGTLLLWKGRSNIKIENAHQGPVTSMTSLPSSNSGTTTGSSDTGPRIISAGRDGHIYMWNSQLVRMWDLDIMQSSPPAYHSQIQAVAFREGKLILGTKAAEIYQVNMLTNESKKIVSGHFIETAEVRALGVHPYKNYFVTAGDDMTVRVWDSKTRKQISITQIKNKCRCCTYSPDGFQISLGLIDGKLIVITDDLQLELIETTITNDSLNTLSYSPNGLLLAIGSDNTNIYLVETRNYNIQTILRGHTGCIRSLDWSICSTIIQSCSTTTELFFWDINTFERILLPSIVRDIEWANWTAIYGWPVQGIWDINNLNTNSNSLLKMEDIQCLDRSSDLKYITVADENHKLKLYKYPCLDSLSFNKKINRHNDNDNTEKIWKEYKGHSSNITNIKYHTNNKWVYSIGGYDKCIMQYNVNYTKEG